jgi:HK97 family phage major capsid protein
LASDLVEEANAGTLANHDKILDCIGGILDANAPFPDAWAAAPRVEIALAKLKEAVNLQPLREPELLGRVTNRLTTTALSDTSSPSNGNALILGGFGEVLVGVREQLDVRVLSEKYADKGQVGFWCWLRMDMQVARAAALGRVTGIDIGKL